MAILGVVAQHAGVSFGEVWTPLDHVLRNSWNTFHVPSFLIVAGFLAWRARELHWADLAPRLARIGIPYLLVSPVAWWILRPEGIALPVALLTGAADGTYYFFFIMFQCITLSWLLSRVGAAGRRALFAALLAYLLAVGVWPELQLTHGFFWVARDPLSSFYFGYFVLGWIVADHQTRLRRLFADYRWPVVAAGALLVAPNVAAWSGRALPLTSNEIRLLYTVGVLTWIVVFMRERSLPRVLRRLSEQTLVIYLLHNVLMQMALPYTMTLHAGLRFAVLASVGLVGSLAIAELARGIFGNARARRFIGA